MRTRLFSRRQVEIVARSFRGGLNACRNVKLNRTQQATPEPTGDFRLLEDSFIRLTESGDFRILE